MNKPMPMMYSAMLLTGVNLFMRFVSTGFQVYLSGRIGAEGMGIMQLTLSLCSMSLVAAMAGIRTTTMYLTAEEVGRGSETNTRWILSGCICYSAVCSCAIAFGMYHASNYFASNWINIPETASIIRIAALFLPIQCLNGVMAGYFTGAKRISSLALVEILEQALSISITILLIHFSSVPDTIKYIQTVFIGNGFGATFSLLVLCILRIWEGTPGSPKIPVAERITDLALPLAAADDLRTGISTLESMIIPKRLTLYPGSITPLADYGMICGMVFPILTFPMAILFGITELMVPELAQCKAAGNEIRIEYLVKRSLKIACLYGVFCASILFISAEKLCLTLYQSTDSGHYLRLFSPLTIMLYTDMVIDAMIKGLGQQKFSVLVNIITNTLDVLLLYLMLPHYGIYGYFFSFTLTHGINFLLSLGRLIKIIQSSKLLPLKKAR